MQINLLCLADYLETNKLGYPLGLRKGEEDIRKCY